MQMVLVQYLLPSMKVPVLNVAGTIGDIQKLSGHGPGQLSLGGPA